MIKPLSFLFEIIENLLFTTGHGSRLKFYTIVADETEDISNEEQLAICFRWVDKALSIHEDFIDLHSMPQTDADSIVKVIQVVTCTYVRNVNLKHYMYFLQTYLILDLRLSYA